MKREQTIDIAKGICILLMFIGHCNGFHPLLYKGIESFHMPFFFIAAGFFYRPKANREVVWSSFKRLIIPLILGVIVCSLIWLFFGYAEQAKHIAESILFPGGTRSKVLFWPDRTDCGVFWFLAALFWSRVLYNMIYQHWRKYALWICVGIGCAFVVISRRFMLPLCLNEGCVGLFFYAIGHIAKEKGIQNYKPARWMIVVFLTIWFVDIHFVSFQMFKVGFDVFFPIGVVFACGMSFLTYRFATRVKGKKTKYMLAWVGMYGIECMFAHECVLTVMRCLHKTGMGWHYGIEAIGILLCSIMGAWLIVKVNNLLKINR